MPQAIAEIESPPEVKWLLSDKQIEALESLKQDDISELLFGGAKGGGKSIVGCRWIFLMAQWVIREFKLSPQTHPVPIAFIGRKKGKHFKDTTLETWKKFIPTNQYEIKEGAQEIIINNTVKIHYGGLDSQEMIEKFNSAEYAFIFIDQGEEITQDDYGMLKATLRLKINGRALPYKILLTANPAQCWLKTDFILQQLKGKRFIPALPSDNPFLPDTYINTLKESFKHRPELLEAYLYGSWDVLESANIIIQGKWVQRAVKRQLHPIGTKRIVVCDPSAFGDDETVIYVMKNEQIIDELIYGKREPMETAGNLIALRNKYQASLIAVDVGYMPGIVSRLKEILKDRPLNKQTFQIKGIDSNATPLNSEKFKNVRAEMWWEAGEKFYQNKTSIPDDWVLVNQLSSVKYKFVSGGKILVEPKEDIKKELGTSPDRADCYVMGLYALKFAHPLGQRLAYPTPVRQVKPNAGMGFPG